MTFRTNPNPPLNVLANPKATKARLTKARHATVSSEEGGASLTDLQKITVAYFHLVKGFAQHDLANMFNVNPGRVSTAITTIRRAIK